MCEEFKGDTHYIHSVPILCVYYIHIIDIDIHFTEKNHSHILIQNDDSLEREVWHNIIQSGVVSILEPSAYCAAPPPPPISL